MRHIMLVIILAAGLASGADYLFDYTKDETAGNADWVIDDDMPYPSPSSPHSGDDWIGGISDWGFDLWESGQTPVTLPPYGSITYGDPSNPLDLSNFDVFIICEPQDPFTAAEKTAILNFVYNGGGLIIVGNHYGSDRNNNGWDSPRVLNDLGTTQYFGMHFNVSGESYNNFTDSPDSNISTDPNDPIIHGPYGDVGAIGFHAGTSITLYPEYNSTVRGHVWISGFSHGNTGVMVASAQYGSGRVVAIGDSSPADDGNGNPGNNLYDGWTAEGEDNYVLFLNACYWVAGGTHNIKPFIRNVQRSPYFPSEYDIVTVWARVSDDGTIYDSIVFKPSGGDWQSLPHDSVVGRVSYYHIPAFSAGTYVYYFVKATDETGLTSCSDTFYYRVGQGGTSNLDGWCLIQENSYNEYTFHNVEIPPGGYLIVARNCTQSEFEEFWGVDLGEDVVFISTGGELPVINGDEVFTLKNASGETVDGPTISMESGVSMQRISPQSPANSYSSWNIVSANAATPGYGGALTNSHKVVINEVSDALGSGNYIYEFVELFYDVDVSAEENEPIRVEINSIPTIFRDIRELRGLTPPYVIYNSLGQKIGFADSNNDLRIAQDDVKTGVYFVKGNGRRLKVLILK